MSGMFWICEFVNVMGEACDSPVKGDIHGFVP